MMPFTSQVGRDWICSISMRPFSPAGMLRPTWPRKASSVEVELVPLLQHLRRRLGHAVVEALERDAAVLVVKVGDDLRQHADRVARRAAEQARNAGRGRRSAR